MSVQVCPKCKKEVSDSNFCPECGEKLNKHEVIPPNDNDSGDFNSAQGSDGDIFEPAETEPIPYVPANDPQGQDPAYYPAIDQNEAEKQVVAKKKKKKAVKIALASFSVLILSVIIISVASKNALTDYEKGQVNEMISSIDALPDEIGLSDESRVEALQGKFDKLNEKQQKKVKNRKEITNAAEEIETLKVNEVIAAIDSIGTVTADSYNSIKSAKEKYQNLPTELRGRVDNYDKLTALEDEYYNVAAEKVKGLINDLGEVTLKSKAKLDEIDNQYKALPEKAKRLVSNYSEYTEAEKKYNKLVEAEKKRKKEEKIKQYKAALQSLRATSDSIKGYKWYYPQSFPNYINTRSYFLPYIATDIKTGELEAVRIKADYTGDDWVFWKKLIINIDGENYYKTVNYFDIEHDNDYGDVWEYYDWEAWYSDIEMLREIAKSKKTIVRFEGDQYHKDIEITANDKQGIKTVLAAYDAWNAAQE